MAKRTELVASIGQAGAIDANRPVDHARRIVTGLAVGSVFGTLFGLVLFLNRLTLGAMVLAALPPVLLGLATLVVWRFVKVPSEGDPVPVVARTLATDESAYSRYLSRGANRGLLVPVVAAPVDGTPAFRSVILIREVRGQGKVQEPEVGTLYALKQVHAGQGELENIEEVTPEQEALMEKLRRHPRTLPNRAPALPVRRGALERTPGWAAAQWWVSNLVAGAAAIGLVVLLA